MCMSLYVCMFTMCLQCSRNQKEGVITPGTRGTGGWGKQIQVLWRNNKYFYLPSHLFSIDEILLICELCIKGHLFFENELY